MVIVMDTMAYLWLFALVLFVVVEAATTQMVCIWFAASSLLALALALLGAPAGAQVIAFLLSSAVLLILTRPIVRRISEKTRTPTNSDRILGMTAVVVQEINDDVSEGQVKVAGQIWTARSVGGETIPVGTKVFIRSIEGVKAFVEKSE